MERGVLESVVENSADGGYLHEEEWPSLCTAAFLVW
jgi:hypothetical protein